MGLSKIGFRGKFRYLTNRRLSARYSFSGQSANYIDNMKRYLSSGHWGDYRYGAQRESRVTRVSVAMAYDNDGRPKRMYGVWYPDIGAVWTRELEDMWGRDYDDEIVQEKKLERERRTETE